MEKGPGIYGPKETNFEVPETRVSDEKNEKLLAEHPGLLDTLWWLATDGNGSPPMSMYGLVVKLAVNKELKKAAIRLISSVEGADQRRIIRIINYLNDEVETQEEFDSNFSTKNKVA